MLKRQRPSSPLPVPAAYDDDLSSSTLGSNTFHPTGDMSTPSTQVDSLFGISRKRPRISQDVTPGATGASGSGSVGRHTFFSSSVLSKRKRSPDPMDDGDGDSDPRPSSTYSDYQQEGEPSYPSASRHTINHKRPRTAAPVLDGPSRGWGPDQTSQFETGLYVPGSNDYPHSFDPVHPPVGWILETQTGEYAQENARLHYLHILRPRLPHSEEMTQDHNGISNEDVDMEEKVVKERYEERNRLLGSLFLERQRRLAGI